MVERLFDQELCRNLTKEELVSLEKEECRIKKMKAQMIQGTPDSRKIIEVNFIPHNNHPVRPTTAKLGRRRRSGILIAQNADWKQKLHNAEKIQGPLFCDPPPKRKSTFKIMNPLVCEKTRISVNGDRLNPPINVEGLKETMLERGCLKVDKEEPVLVS